MNHKKTVALFTVVLLSFTTLSYSLVGAGLHYGIDNSVGMDDTRIFGERVSLVRNQFEFSIGNETLPISESFPLMYVSRLNFERTPVNFGGKVFWDLVPFVDGVEMSANFGMWEYEGAVHFLNFAALANKTPEEVNQIKNNPYDPEQYSYIIQELTLDALGLSYWGQRRTPYARLHIDMTVRKDLVKFPPVINILRIYTGTGLSMNFSTPVLSAKLIEDVLSKNNDFDLEFFENLATMENPEEIWSGVVERIIDGFAKPVIGMHLMAGMQVKLPVVPVGLYVDGKILIPFGSLNKDVEVGGVGFLINSGISMSF
ncbi:hypothetical protein CHISP_0495 [Chitinispirillum alkaliphilum]|nr:hypothetical protein CHISP_0495 [Chitinispirillum alkaliphilum]